MTQKVVCVVHGPVVPELPPALGLLRYAVHLPYPGEPTEHPPDVEGVATAWLDDDGLFSYIRPDAGAIVYVRYQHGINSTELVTRLREQKSVLIVPGDHFGMDGYLRIGFGDEPAYLRQGLTRLREVLEEIPT